MTAPAAELIPFPLVPITRTDIPEGATTPGERALRLRQSDSDARLDKELAKSEALLWVDLGLLLEEMCRIGGREFTLDAVVLQMRLHGFDIIGVDRT
jgi:hypothetical protein